MHHNFLLPSNWKNYSELSDIEIDEVEEKIDRVFPTSYRNLMKKYNGGISGISSFNLTQDQQSFREGIDWFLNLKEDIQYLEIPKDVQVISKNTNGSFICLDYRQDKYSPLVFDWWTSRANSEFSHYFFNPPEAFPLGIVSFGGTAGSDLIGFDYRNNIESKNPPVVYWDHEAEPGKDLFFVAHSFDEFLDMLYPYSEK